MKKIAFLLALFLTAPAVVWAQLDQKELLNQAMTWIDGNLQCQEYVAGDPGELSKETPSGKCSNVDSNCTTFCHLFSPQTTQLILAAAGSSGQRIGGWWETDEKYIMFTLYDGKLLADVFDENGGGTVKKVEMPNKPDLILIEDGDIYGNTRKASLFAGSARKMKLVLDYDAGQVGMQTPAGFETLLIPLDQGGFKLLKLETFSNDAINISDMKVSRSLYRLDQETGTYTLSEKEKEIPFVQGILDWWENGDRLNGGISDEGFEPFIQVHPDYLGQIIEFLKLPKFNADRKYAHQILVDIAGKDLGEDYPVWKKWEKENASDSQ